MKPHIGQFLFCTWDLFVLGTSNNTQITENPAVVAVRISNPYGKPLERYVMWFHKTLPMLLDKSIASIFRASFWEMEALRFFRHFSHFLQDYMESLSTREVFFIVTAFKKIKSLKTEKNARGKSLDHR